jgi:hypothetical protein
MEYWSNGVTGMASLHHSQATSWDVPEPFDRAQGKLREASRILGRDSSASPRNDKTSACPKKESVT